MPEISDYGLIGNCRTSALVSRFGAVEWCCLPYFDSDSYFAALLDRARGGRFLLCPAVPFTSRQAYIADTNVLETRFETAGGSARLLDCFSATSDRRKREMFVPVSELLRKLEVTRGSMPFRLNYAPKPHYGLHSHSLSASDRTKFDYECGHDVLRFRSELEPNRLEWHDEEGGPEAEARFELRGGEKRFFSVSYHEIAPSLVPALGEAAEQRLRCTQEFWRSWSAHCRYRGPYAAQVRRSALALKLMDFAPSGAIVAAPTTSLPETVGGERNWDYRYAWLRDAAFTVRALVRLGYHPEARAYLNWMLDTGAGAVGRYRVLYNLFGAAPPPERQLPGLSGYRGSRPVRIGNEAANQFQLDIYGEVLGSVASFPREDLELDGDTRRFLIGMGHQVCRLWDKPDDGIWEPRSPRLHHTHSKAMAWAALDRLIGIARDREVRGIPLQEFAQMRERIRESIETRAYSPRLASYTGAFGTDRMDAALLALPLIGYCDARSLRMQGTIRQVRRELACGDLVYRYCGLDDGLSGREGCFGVCSFWLIEALARGGRVREAHRLFERFLSRGNEAGLWPEEIDPASGRFLGNYPQSFTHIGLINAALTLQECAPP